MKTILVPTDFSEPSIYGLSFAAALAKKSRSSIHLFHAALISNYYYSGDPSNIAPPAELMMQGINENLKKHALTRLKGLASKKFLNGLKVSYSCENALNIHNTILDEAYNLKAGMIVMGSRGAGNLKTIVLGSNAERVVRFSSIPVIVVPAKTGIRSMANIVFASDFKKEANAIFPFVKEFARLFRSKLHLLKVVTMDQFSRTNDDSALLEGFSKKYGGGFITAVYNDYMKEEGILNYAKQSRAGLIAIGTHGKKGLRRFFSEDVSEGIVRLSRTPILIVNLKKFTKHFSIF
jgi:nucleotide-binding universal stress UspA family protein